MLIWEKQVKLVWKTFNVRGSGYLKSFADRFLELSHPILWTLKTQHGRKILGTWTHPTGQQAFYLLITNTTQATQQPAKLSHTHKQQDVFSLDYSNCFYLYHYFRSPTHINNALKHIIQHPSLYETKVSTLYNRVPFVNIKALANNLTITFLTALMSVNKTIVIYVSSQCNNLY